MSEALRLSVARFRGGTYAAAAVTSREARATPGDVDLESHREVSGKGRETALRWWLGLALFLATITWAIAFGDGQQYNDAQSAGFPWYLVAQGLACLGIGVITRNWWVVGL